MYLDVHRKWEAIKQRAAAGISSLFPINGKNNSIILDDIVVDDKYEGVVPLSRQRKAIVEAKSVTIPIQGHLRLVTKDGRTLDKRTIKLLDLPIMNQRGTYILSGKNYSLFNQMRLRPGIYTSKDEASGKATTKFNVGKGVSFRLVLDELKGVIYVVVAATGGESTGSTKIPVISLLHLLGVSDADIKKAWGEKLYATNISAADLAKDGETLVKLFVYTTKRTGNNALDISEHLKTSTLNPETTKITLGKAFEHVNGQAVLLASTKLVNVHKDEVPDDDLDSLLFKEILSDEDHIFNRIVKGAKESGGVLFKMRMRVDQAEKLSQVIPNNTFTHLINTFFTTSSLSSTPTEINPLEILETDKKITAMGEGGIQSEHGIPMSARNLHPSHLGFLDPIRTVESMRVGVDLRMTEDAHAKGRGTGDIVATFIDSKGRPHQLTPMEVYGHYIGFPLKDDERSAALRSNKIVQAMYKSDMCEVRASKIDYWVPTGQSMFTTNSILVPFLQNDQGNRLAMASRMISQALPLVNREAPLVQIQSDDTPSKSVEHIIGSKYLSAKAPCSGKVTEVTSSAIHIKPTKGPEEIVELYKDFPLNYKTGVTTTADVKVGDTVTSGQPIAGSNFTKDGRLAIGTNMHIGYLSYKGYNNDDSIVISQSAAEKLISDHMYVEEINIPEGGMVDRKKYATFFPTKVTPEQLHKVADNGIVAEGTEVHSDDPLVLLMVKRIVSDADRVLLNLGKGIVNPFKDQALRWHHTDPGIVTDVHIDAKKIRLVIKVKGHIMLGDKLTGRHGNKGTIGLILPDNEMPHTADGKPLDMLLQPASVPSRVNPGQLYETIAGKIAQKTGRPYLVSNFKQGDTSKTLLAEAKGHGITPTEEVFDPKTKKSLGKVMTGYQYTLKLHKQTEGNLSARDVGGYDANMQPAKGGNEGAKGMGLLDIYALLGHNARGVLHEATAYKSQKNEAFWDALRLGMPLPAPKEPFVFDKLKALMAASGVQVTKHISESGDHSYQVSPMTDRDTLNHSAGEVKEGLLLKGDTAKMLPEKDGLFDQTLTGGLHGKQWSHIELAEPIVNPVFAGVVKTLLTGQGYDPKELANMHGTDIKKALKDIDVPKRIKALTEAIPKLKTTKRDHAIKELKYLTALKKMNMDPHEYIITKFPVIPPVYRPIYQSATSSKLVVSDLNNLYKDALVANNTLRETHKEFEDAPADIRAEHTQALRHDLQRAIGAIIGVTEPINAKSQKQQLKGALTTIVGGTAKDGYFHRKILYRPQDMTGRGTILPDPTLHVDEAKLPKSMLMELYTPFIIKQLVTQHGYSPIQAAKEVKEGSKLIDDILNAELKTRPVILNRAPTLHKFNMLAFNAKPVEGHSIFIPPLVAKGFNADYDGDSISGDSYVLVSDERGHKQLKQIRDVK